MRYKANELKYERVRILGKIGFFTNERIQKDSVPERVFQYEVRHDDLCQGIPCEVAKGILVNFWGTLLTLTELSEVEQNGYQDLKTCIKQWIKDGVVDFEDQAHPYRKRILFPAAGAKSGNKGAVDRVLVFRVFRDETETTAVEEADRKAPPVSQLSQKCPKLITGEDNDDETAYPA